MNREDCILYSGASTGAEAAFGEAAERHGIEEVNFTFEGHKDVRTRGLHVLTHVELKQGDVSLAYVSRLMNRTFSDTPLFRKILQSIWHQVNSAQEIYVVGHILKDGTVKGGTGWAAEFAKLCNKVLYVFDQEQSGWSRWTGDTWTQESSPRITHPNFAGTGTRGLQDNGQKAIRDLFDRSFQQ